MVNETDKILIALVIRDVDESLNRDFAIESMDLLGWQRNFGS